MLYSICKVDYIESNNDDVKIIYNSYKYCHLDSYRYYQNGYELVSECESYPKIIKDYLSKLNNKIILNDISDIKEINIYTNHENIIKLQENEKKYLKELNDDNFENERNYYENVIQELERELESYENNCNY